MRKKGIYLRRQIKYKIIYSGQREKTIYTGSIKSKFGKNKRNLTCYRSKSFLVLVTSHKLNFRPGQGWSGITIYSISNPEIPVQFVFKILYKRVVKYL